MLNCVQYRYPDAELPAAGDDRTPFCSDRHLFRQVTSGGPERRPAHGSQVTPSRSMSKIAFSR